MNLRFKIFVWIGGLFLLGFVASQVLEERVTAKSLLQEEELLKNQIFAQDEIRRQNIERYVRNSLDQEKEKITVLFSKIQNYPWLYNRFAPTLYNAKNGTWLASSTLIDTNKWIDFIQNTNEGILSSQVIIDDRYTKEAIYLAITPTVGCIATRDFGDSAFDGPFIAIPYDYEEVTYTNDEYYRTSAINAYRDNGYYLLFSPKQLMNLSVPDLKKNFQKMDTQWKSQGVNFDSNSGLYKMLLNTIQRIEEAQELFKNQKELLNKITLENRKNWVFNAIESQGIDCREEKIDNLEKEIFIKQSRRFDQIVNIWELTTLLSINLFGKEPFSDDFPIGIAQVPDQKKCGEAFFNQNFLFDQMNISTRKYQGKIGNLEDLSVLVYKDQHDRLFFGAVLSMTAKEENQDLRRGTLTIAIDAKHIVQNLSLAANANALFISGGKVLKGFFANGDVMPVDEMKISTSDLLAKNSGFITIQDVEYFYLLLRPFTDIDMNFVLLSPKNKEFALITVLNSTAKLLIERISNQMHGIVFIALLIVLFALNNIVGHIVFPIKLLADACDVMSLGKLQEITLPDLKKKSRDEVYRLYQSFKEMISSLKEKEKVMGVLNKVVSPTIAQEILKGNVHLGGEEKVVTVLFADIRNFSKTTEKMNPVEVINLLNSCMTVVSRVIDRHHGVIDKYVGDEVMALFGAPVPLVDAPIEAVRCALEIQQELKKWNEERSMKKLPLVEMGIGIHTGLVVAGNMGAEDRLNYTVLGANVNLASRICSVAKPSEVLVSVSTLQTGDTVKQFSIEPLPPQDVKGFSESISLYRVIKPL